MSDIIILTLSCLSLFSIGFLFIGSIFIAIQQKGFTNVLEILLFAGMAFTIFILGMVVFAGGFIL